MEILPFLLLISIHQLETTLCSSSLTFVQEPATKYVFADKNSSFQCICSGCDAQFWNINGINANYDYNKNKGVLTKGPIVNDGHKKYILNIPAIDFFNNSNITCHIYHNEDYQNVEMSRTANLRIQGFASAVTNISALQLNSTSLRMSFCPSFALDASVAVDYYIVDVTAAMNEGVIKHINTSSTEVTVSLADHCSNYTVSITPYNSIGQGEKNTKTDIIIFQEPVVIGDITVETMVLKTFYGVWIVFKVNTSCLGSVPRQVDVSIICVSKKCSSTYLQPCWLNIIDGFSNPSGNCSIDVYSISPDITAIRVNLTEYIAQGSYYKINVTLRTSLLPVVPSATSAFNLSTFLTTDAKITSFSYASVCIKCSLHQDSITTGCLALFEDVYNEDSVIKLVVNRIPDEVIAYDCFESLQDGHYRVSVTDVEYYSEENLEHIAFVLLDELAIQKLLPAVETLNHFSIESISTNMDESRIAIDAMRTSLTYRLTGFTTRTTEPYSASVMGLTPSSLVILTNVHQQEFMDDDNRITLILSAILSPVAGIVLFGVTCLVIILMVVYRKKAQSTTGADYRSRGVTISYVDSDTKFSKDYQNSGAELEVRKCVAYETCPINNPVYATITDIQLIKHTQHYQQN